MLLGKQTSLSYLLVKHAIYSQGSFDIYTLKILLPYHFISFHLLTIWPFKKLDVANFVETTYKYLVKYEVLELFLTFKWVMAE